MTEPVGWVGCRDGLMGQPVSWGRAMGGLEEFNRRVVTVAGIGRGYPLYMVCREGATRAFLGT